MTDVVVERTKCPIKTLGDLSKPPSTGFPPVAYFEFSSPQLKASLFSSLFFFLLTWVFYCAESFYFNKAHDEMTASPLREVHEYF